MQPSENCYKLIKHFEKFMPNPYLCPAGVPTIGYGTTAYPNGRKVRLNDATLTEPAANDYMEHEVEQLAPGVTKLLKVKVTQSLFDALLCFAYNVGLGALAGSTLLRLVNSGVVGKEGWKRTLTKEFAKWCKARQGGKLVVLKGLVGRRMSEAWLACEGQVKFFTV